MKKKNLDKYSLELDARGFLWIRHKSNISFDLNDAINQRDEIVSICEEKRTPFLVDVRVTNWTAEKGVREFHASDEQLLSIKNAEAILVNNAGIRLLANFYQKMNKPPVPVKVFTDEEKAIKWVSSFF